MRIRFLKITITFLFFFLPFLSLAGGSGPDYDDYSAELEKIDELLFQGENQLALQMLKELPADDPDSAETLWRLARVHYEMGRLEKERPFELFKQSEEYARATISEAPGNSEGYKWLAIALGAQAKFSDTKTQVRQSREIKESIEEAIVLNPEDDISYLVLSRWHYKVSGLGTLARTFAKIVYGGIPKASLAEAEDLLLQAIALHDRISHRYNLAKVYDRMGRNADAKAQLQNALRLPLTFPEEAEELEKSRKKLKDNNV